MSYGGSLAQTPAASTLEELDAAFASVETGDLITEGKQLRLAGPLALGPGTPASAFRHLEHVGHGNAQSIFRIDAPEVTSDIFRVQLFADMGSSGENSLDIYDGAAPSSTLIHRIEGKPTAPSYFCATDRGQLIVGSAGTLHGSAIFGIISTTRGFLPPLMTTTQRDAIPATEGLVIFNITTHKLNVKGASAWEAVTSV